MYGKKNLSSIDARLDIFFKKYKANKNDVLKVNIRKIDELTKEDFARV